jgi:hypothetical protein
MRAPALLLLAAAARADYIFSQVFGSCAPGKPALFQLAEFPAQCQALGGQSSSLRCSSDGNVSLVRFDTFGCSGPVTGQLPYPFTPDCSDVSGKPRERSTCVRGDYAEPQDHINLGLYLTPGNDCVGPPTILESIPAEACLDIDGARGSVLLTCREPGFVGSVVEKLFEGAACAGPVANFTVHQPGCRSEQAGEEGGAATAALLTAAPRRAAALHREQQQQQQQQQQQPSGASASASRTPTASRTPSSSPAPPAPPAPARQSYSVWKCPAA